VISIKRWLSLIRRPHGKFGWAVGEEQGGSGVRCPSGRPVGVLVTASPRPWDEHVGLIAQDVVVAAARPGQHRAQVDQASDWAARRDERDGQAAQRVADQDEVVRGVGEGFDGGVGVLDGAGVAVLAW
jgi:hypothetical protein